MSLSLTLHSIASIIRFMDGLLLIDKPAGPTSHDMVDVVRRATGMRAVGHAGTLDPFATGLLILGLGKATKWLTQLVGLDKTYEATLRLGATSDTFDRDGVISPTANPTDIPTLEQIESTLNTYRGTFEQRAPLYSAKKLQGKKLYELARAGTATESMRPTKQITIHRLEIVSYTYPELTLLVDCSYGTYIRSLADDIGRDLGVGAYLTELRRTAIGAYSVQTALSRAQITREEIDAHLIRNLDNLAQN